MEVLGWVLLSKISVELEVDELEKGSVELQESAHDLVIDIKRQSLIELIRGDPSDGLPHDLNLVVDTLDGEESLFEALGDCAIQHELFHQTLALFNLLLGDLQ